MKILNNEQTDICIKQFKELIEKECEIEVLFDILDKAMYEYARFVMHDINFVGSRGCSEDRIYFYLNELRMTFTDKSEVV